MEDLTQKDLDNLGKWIQDGEWIDNTPRNYLKIGDFRLYKHSKTIYSINNRDGFEILPPFKAQTKEELSRYCYFCEGKDLDFEPKKTYSWKSVSESMTNEEIDSFDFFCNNLSNINLISEKEWESIIAGVKLRIIVDEINADFPSVDDSVQYPWSFGGLIQSYSTHKNHSMNPLMVASKQGFEKLLETNLPLLEQYFMIDKNSEE